MTLVYHTVELIQTRFTFTAIGSRAFKRHKHRILTRTVILDWAIGF